MMLSPFPMYGSEGCCIQSVCAEIRMNKSKCIKDA